MIGECVHHLCAIFILCFSVFRRWLYLFGTVICLQFIFEGQWNASRDVFASVSARWETIKKRLQTLLILWAE